MQKCLNNDKMLFGCYNSEKVRKKLNLCRENRISIFMPRKSYINRKQEIQNTKNDKKKKQKELFFELVRIREHEILQYNDTSSTRIYRNSVCGKHELRCLRCGTVFSISSSNYLRASTGLGLCLNPSCKSLSARIAYSQRYQPETFQSDLDKFQSDLDNKTSTLTGTRNRSARRRVQIQLNKKADPQRSDPAFGPPPRFAGVTGTRRG
jgi:hypothetical protein